ncbi:hypothetical protein AOLI_G00103530 [Acnodon oligacanthus]
MRCQERPLFPGTAFSHFISRSGDYLHFLAIGSGKQAVGSALVVERMSDILPLRWNPAGISPLRLRLCPIEDGSGSLRDFPQEGPEFQHKPP